MAYEANLQILPALEADGDLSAKQFTFVNINSVGKIAANGSAGFPSVGVLQDKPVSTGLVQKACIAPTYLMAAADTLVLDVNNVGNATCTWDAAAATITDTTTYAVADQDTLTCIVTLTGGPYDGVAQTVLFNAATTTALLVASGINAQVVGCSADGTSGQVVITHDDKGSGMDIAVGAGTGALTWAASAVGTGDAANIRAVTAAEIKTIIELDSTADVNIDTGTPVISASTELEFVSGNALAILGLIAEVLLPNENAKPGSVAYGGVTKVKAGAAVTPDDKIMSDANGAGIPVTSGNFFRGQALTGAASGELFSMSLAPTGYLP